MNSSEINNLIGDCLIGAYVEYNEDFIPGNNETVLNKICLSFENGQITFRPNTDTDEVIVEYSTSSGLPGDYSVPNVFTKHTGKQMSMLWRCENSNNYADLIVLSFNQLHPSILILSEGSVLKVFSSNIL